MPALGLGPRVRKTQTAKAITRVWVGVNPLEPNPRGAKMENKLGRLSSQVNISLTSRATDKSSNRRLIVNKPKALGLVE